MIRKLIVITLMSALVLAFVAIGLMGWFEGKTMPILNRVVTIPILERPAMLVVRDMKSAMGNLATARYQLNASVVPTSAEPVSMIGLETVFDGAVAPQLLGTLVFTASFEVQNLTYVAAADMRFTQDTDYVNITEVPALSFMNLSPVVGTWYVFNANDVAGTGDGQWHDLGQEVTKSSLVESYSRLPDETIDGNDVYHYGLRLRESAVQDFFSRWSETLWPGVTGEALGRYMGGQRVVNAEVWIGKKDFLLRRFDVTTGGDQADCTITLSVDRFNQDVAVEKPGDAVPIADFPTALFGKTNWLDLPLFGYQLGINVQSWTTDDDHDGLYALWEHVFGTDPNNTDTDGDGYADGVEVRSGYTPSGAGKFMAGW